MAIGRAGRGAQLRRTVELWTELFERHNILRNASAIGLRVLVSLIPLTLLGVALLGAFGFEDVWRNDVAPALKSHFRPSVFHAVDSSTREIFSHGTALLVAFAAALSVWDLSSTVRASMGALDEIYEQDDKRSTAHRFALSLALGMGIGLCLAGAILVLVTGPKLAADNTVLHGLLGLGRWAVAVVLLSGAVGLLVQFAPARRRAERWVGVGTFLVVLTWILATLAFRWFVGSVANFKSAAGVLAAFLVLTSYVYTSSIIFLVGVEVDELLRKGRWTK